MGALLLAVASPTFAQSTPDATAREQALEARIDALNERIARLEALLERSAPPMEEAPPADPPNAAWPSRDEVLARLDQLEQQVNRHDTPIDAHWKDGLQFSSRDGRFKFGIGGRIHFDAAIMDADNDLERNRRLRRLWHPVPEIGDLDDGVEMRRARLSFSGTIHEQGHVKIEFDFAGGDVVMKDVYVGWDDLPLIGANLRVGHFKEPFGFAEMMSSNDMTYMERSPVSNAIAPSRNAGVMLFDTALDERLTWAAGVFVATGDDSNGDLDDGVRYTMRVTGLPYYADDGRRLVHVGLGYSHQNYEGDRRLGEHLARLSERPAVHLAPRFVDTGPFYVESADLIAAEFAWVHGPFSMQAEYLQQWMDGLDGAFSDDPGFHGYYMQASYFLTGEHRPYDRVKGVFGRLHPTNAFGPEGWGAWEVAARYDHLDLDDERINGGEVDNLSFALNWYWNPNIRVMFNYVMADVEDGGDAHAFQWRWQLAL